MLQLVLLTTSSSALELKQVHVVTRHGSRRPLPKTAVTLEETSETSLLTPLGQQQHYELGLWLQERYLDHFGDILDEFDPIKYTWSRRRTNELLHPLIHSLWDSFQEPHVVYN